VGSRAPAGASRACTCASCYLAEFERRFGWRGARPADTLCVHSGQSKRCMTKWQSVRTIGRTEEWYRGLDHRPIENARQRLWSAEYRRRVEETAGAATVARSRQGAKPTSFKTIRRDAPAIDREITDARIGRTAQTVWVRGLRSYASQIGQPYASERHYLTNLSRKV